MSNFFLQQSIEEAWAEKAHGHAMTYFRIITNISSPRMLALTPQDNDIYTSFRKEFPALEVKSLDIPALKSAAGKEVRPLLWNKFKNLFFSFIDQPAMRVAKYHFIFHSIVMSICYWVRKGLSDDITFCDLLDTYRVGRFFLWNRKDEMRITEFEIAESQSRIKSIRNNWFTTAVTH